jgi:hypothetical protein
MEVPIMEFFNDKINSEEGAETVEIIIGIVVFVIFGLTVFGLVTNAAGGKAASISNCLADSGNLLSGASTDGHASSANTCKKTDDKTYTYNGNK